jgi:hypothetical protein
LTGQQQQQQQQQEPVQLAVALAKQHLLPKEKKETLLLL